MTGTGAWSMRTTNMMEHGHGIAWVADLLLDGVKVGTIEQGGRGGADEVWVESEYREAWRSHVAGIDGGEEEATFALMCAEDEAGL